MPRCGQREMSLLHHLRHRSVSATNEWSKPSNPGSICRLVKVAKTTFEIKSSAGLGGSSSSSMNPPLERKKDHSCIEIKFCSSRIICTEIRKEKSFLSFSKSPRQTCV